MAKFEMSTVQQKLLAFFKPVKISSQVAQQMML